MVRDHQQADQKCLIRSALKTLFSLLRLIQSLLLTIIIFFLHCNWTVHGREFNQEFDFAFAVHGDARRSKGSEQDCYEHNVGSFPGRSENARGEIVNETFVMILKFEI